MLSCGFISGDCSGFLVLRKTYVGGATPADIEILGSSMREAEASYQFSSLSMGWPDSLCYLPETI